MNPMFTVFAKELLDTLRDKRSLIFMILMPLLVFPVLINISVALSSKHMITAQTRILKVGLLGKDQDAILKNKLDQVKDIELRTTIDKSAIKSLIEKKELDFVIEIDQYFSQKINDNQAGTVHLYYHSNQEINIAKKRITDILNELETEIINRRFAALELNTDIMKALRINEHDQATVKQKVADAIGGILPYLLIIFCFTSAMYPAIDIGAGEKERGTIETLLVSPISRSQIVMGKFLLIFLTALTGAVVTIIGLVISTRMQKNMPADLFNSIIKILDIKSILFSLSLLIPLCVFFAAVLLSLSIYAQSTKEAQSIISPLSIVVIVPVFLGMLPGIELTAITAAIPVLNVTLATKQILGETVNVALIIETYISQLIYAIISLWICTRLFHRESTLFRSN
jgi:sodium transport system permease protein